MARTSGPEPPALPLAARGGSAAKRKNQAAAPVARAQRLCRFTCVVMRALGQGRRRATPASPGSQRGSSQAASPSGGSVSRWRRSATSFRERGLRSVPTREAARCRSD
jgi:hypothetical protein